MLLKRSTEKEKTLRMEIGLPLNTQNSINGTDRDSHHDRNHVINQQKPFLDSCNQ